MKRKRWTKGWFSKLFYLSEETMRKHPIIEKYERKYGNGNLQNKDGEWKVKKEDLLPEELFEI